MTYILRERSKKCINARFVEKRLRGLTLKVESILISVRGATRKDTKKKGEIKVRLVSWLYKLARHANDFETISSGKPKKMARRAKNKIIGRKIWPKINKFPF